ncbi:MAG: Bax inhibitor-1/YccA family protein [Candidatus Dojkabacteria bacterium]
MQSTPGLIQESSTVFGSFMAQVYGWMVIGLMVTFAVAFGVEFITERNEQIYLLLATLSPFIIIGQLIIVLVMAFLWRKMNVFISAGLFLFYSLTMGLFFGIIFLDFTSSSILLVFGATIATFVVMALFGTLTKQDLTSWGRLALFGLLGLIIATVINIVFYLFNPGLAQSFEWVLTYLGVGIFLILIAYDTQKLKTMAASAEQSGLGMANVAIQGALTLYLDFINIFIRLLFIMGKRK